MSCSSQLRLLVVSHFSFRLFVFSFSLFVCLLSHFSLFPSDIMILYTKFLIIIIYNLSKSNYSDYIFVYLTLCGEVSFLFVSARVTPKVSLVYYDCTYLLILERNTLFFITVICKYAY